MQRNSILVFAVAALFCGVPVQAQTPADPALADCAAAGAAKQEIQAKEAAARAEQLFRSQLAADPGSADARVGLARVISECRFPFAGFMSVGRLSGRAIDLLRDALAIDSNHWTGRYTLAMHYYYMPEFLGRTDDAIREFERLVAQQGTRADRPVFAQPHLRLGELYLRQGEAARAVEVWRRGAALFPDNAALREHLSEKERRAETAGEAAPTAAAAAEKTRDHGPERPVVLPELVVATSANRMDDTRSGTAVRWLDVLMTPGGAADLMQAFQTGLGTTRAHEGSDLYVRGGDPAEAPVWVDGARLPYAGRHETLHGGVFGVLDPAVLEAAFFSSGGFSARYGNALSGVLDVRTTGLPDAATGVLQANTVSAGAMVQAPLGSGWGGCGAGRATEGTLMLAMHRRLDEFSVPPRALEGMAGAVWEPRPGWQLKATTLLDTDESAAEITTGGFTGPFTSRGSNRLLSLGGRAIRSDGRAALRANLSATARTSAFEFGVLDGDGLHWNCLPPGSDPFLLPGNGSY